MSRDSSSAFGRNLAELLDSMGNLVEKSATARTLESLIPDLLESALKFTNLESGAIYLVGDSNDALQLMAEGGAAPAPEHRRMRVLLGEGSIGRVFQDGRMIVVEDTQQNPAEGESAARLGMRSQICLPLQTGEQLLGVLELSDSRPHSFAREEMAVLQSLAGHIAVLLFGSRLFIQSRAATVQLTRLYDFGSRILAATTFSQALELTARFALLATTAHSAVIHLIDPEGKVELSYGEDSSGNEIREEGGLFPEAAIRGICASGKPSVFHQEDLEKLIDGKHLQGWSIVTLVGLPLQIRAQSIGVLLVRYAAPHNFTQVEMDGLTLYAVQAAGTIERLRLLEESRQRESDLRMIVDMARVVTSTLNIEELLQQIAVLLVWTARMDACIILSADVEHNQMRTLAAYSAFGERADGDFGSGYALSDYPATAQSLKGSDPILLRADDPQCHPSEADVLRRLKYGAVLLIPLWAGGKALGLVKLYSRRGDRTLSHLELQRLRVPAEQAALALVNARLYESEREQRILAETLREIGLILSGSLKAGTILETLLEQIGRVVPFDSASVMMLQGDRVRVASHRGYERFGLTEWISRLDLPIERLTGIHRMAQTRRPHFVPDVQNDPTWQAAGPAWHVGSWVGAPLVTRDQLLGFLSMDKAERGYYTAEHAGHLESLAGHAALALLNALTFGEVEQNSITDFVTGIYNRRYFHEQLQLELDRARRIGYGVSLLIFDIDHFKRVNDTYGHPVGDRVLQMTAARIKEELRAVDILARYGGEEFAVILPGTPASSLAGVGERLRQIIAMRPFMVDDQPIEITVSAGGATFPDDASDAQGLVDEADRRLYAAKEAGRNRIRASEPGEWTLSEPKTDGRPEEETG
jgi:diguanylate cyclase (GGDEF)-like protein